VVTKDICEIFGVDDEMMIQENVKLFKVLFLRLKDFCRVCTL